MNWGRQLLWGISDLVDDIKGFFGSIMYAITQFFWSIFYMIWKLMATFVDSIETIFRGLAGLDTKKGDMVRLIINNSAVKQIFANLVAVSTAILIFFTILKIIQQHYKEKDGGNPYIIVFRMFKGMLMFFFVTAAVMVGLYASGVVFRALDAATANGTKTVSGQIFTAMAYDANRLRMGRPSDDGIMADAIDKAYRMINPSSNIDGEGYMIAKKSGGAITNKQVEEVIKSLDIYNWGIEDEHGNLHPLYGVDPNDDGFSFDWSGSVYDKDAWTKTIQEFTSEDGHVAGTVGYQNDFLKAINLHVTPKINLSWSPVEKWMDRWQITIDSGEIDTSPMVMGTRIPMSYRKYFFDMPVGGHQQVPLNEDSVFAINISGGVSLQGDTVSASFDLSAFASKQPVNKILATLLANVLITRLADWGLRSLPGIPLWFKVYAVEIDLRPVMKLIVQPVIDYVTKGATWLCSFGEMGGEELLESENFIEVGTSSDMPIDITRYEFDDNFEDLWSQLVDNFKAMKDSLDTSFQANAITATKAMKQVDALVGDAKQQAAWAYYKAKVDDYNDKAANYLWQLGKLFNDYNNRVWEQDQDLYNSEADCKSQIQVAYAGLIEAADTMNEYENKYRPTAYQARTYIDRIYKPIFQTKVKYNSAIANGTMQTSLDNIKKELKSATYNLIWDSTAMLDPNGSGENGYYKIVDWAAYNKGVKDALKGYFDLSDYDDYYSIPMVFNAGDDGFAYLTYPESGIGVTLPTIDSYNYDHALGKFGFDGIYYGGTHYREITDSSGSTTVDCDGAHVRDIFRASLNSSSDASIRASQAERNASLASLTSQVHQRFSTDEDKEISPETQAILDEMNILRFRRINRVSPSKQNTVATDEASVGAPGDWVRSTFSLKSTGGTCTLEKITNGSDMDKRADAIDYYMTTTDSTTRNYLVHVTKPGFKSAQITLDDVDDLTGRLSYTDVTTVKCLYDMGSMSYFIGYVGIIVVIGVYMNFTFGLIQRAVNLAVLYMMSPITIAFFPFDDGSKFNSSFVMPFYKEAISAYAIILSMNIYFVLFVPVKKAVMTVTNDSNLMGALAMIAFVSMLPKIRDSITEILGAKSIQSKGLSDMLKDAGSTLSDPFKQMGSIGKSAWDHTKGARKFAGSMYDRTRRNWDKHKEKFKNSKLGWAGSFLAKHTGGALGKVGSAVGGKMNSIKKEIDDVRNGRVPAHQMSKAAKAMMRLQDGKSYLQNTKLGKGAGKLANGALGISKKAAKKFTSGVKANAVAFTTTKSNGSFMGDVFASLGTTFRDSGVGKKVSWFSATEWAKREEEREKREKEINAHHSRGKQEKTRALQDASEYALDADKGLNQASKLAAGTTIANKMSRKEMFELLVADEYRRKNQNATAAEAKTYAQQQYNDILSKAGASNAEKKGLIAEEISRLGGSGQIAFMLENGKVAGYQLDVASEKNDIEALKKLSKDDLLARKKTLFSAHEQSLQQLSQDIVQEAVGPNSNLSKDEMTALQNTVMNQISSGKSVPEIIKAMAGVVPGIDTAAAQSNLDNRGFGAKINSFQTELGSDAIKVSAVLDYKKALEKADKSMMEIYGVHFNSAEGQKLYAEYKAVYDTNDPNSYVSQKQRLIDKYGDESDPSYIAEIGALDKKYLGRLEKVMDSMVSDSAAFVRDNNTKYFERKDNERSFAVAKEMEKRLSYHYDVNLSKEMKDVLLNCKEWNQMKTEGNFGQLSKSMREAVDHALKGDREGMKKLGLNEETQKQLMNMGQTRQGAEQLHHLAGLADIQDKFMGTAGGDMSGPVTAAARNQITAVWQVLESKKTIDYIDTRVKMYDQRELELTNTVETVRSRTKDMFEGSAWEYVQNNVLKFKDENGKALAGKEFKNYMQGFMDRIAQGVIAVEDAEAQKVFGALSNLKSEWNKLGLENATKLDSRQVDEILGPLLSVKGAKTELGTIDVKKNELETQKGQIFASSRQAQQRLAKDMQQ